MTSPVKCLVGEGVHNNSGLLARLDFIDGRFVDGDFRHH